MTSIGQILADARRKRKMTVKDVEKAIKIRAKYITALESDAFDQISGDAYVVGFLKTYAQCLEIDSCALLERYREQTGSAIKPTQALLGATIDDARPNRRNKVVFILVTAAVLLLAAAKIIMLVLSAAGR